MGMQGVQGIQKVGVLGCGLMGSGIAQVVATAGYPTTVRDVSEDFLKKGMTGIEKSLLAWLWRINTSETEPMVTPRNLTGAPGFRPLSEASK